jgi:signal transduction histidine kinase
LRGSAARVHSAKVALAATSAILVGYLVAAGALDLFVVHRLTTEADERMAHQLDSAARVTASSPTTTPRPAPERDTDDAPVFLWRVAHGGQATALTQGAPPLPRHAWSTAGTTALSLRGSPFRLQSVRSGGGWLVAGQSARQVERVRNDLLVSEALLGAVVLVLAYLGAFTIGIRASAPIERLRRQHADFTADASHELRTPLSVIEAEVQLALERPRERAYYREALERISGESGRLRRIVEDLLWLTRADAGEPDRTANLVDVAAAARDCTQRFGAVASSRAIRLEMLSEPEQPSLLAAPAGWVERLVGVLLDNACRHAGQGGRVRVGVAVHANRMSLTVEDTGPGIPPEHRERIFDRFHRGTTEPGGAGLGLSIADAVVEATGGRWSVGRSTLGGARLEVVWRPVHALEGNGSRRRPAGTPDGAGSTLATTQVPSIGPARRRPQDEAREPS